MKDALKTLFWGGRDKEIQAGKKLIAAKKSMKYIIVTDKFKSLKRYVQCQFQLTDKSCFINSFLWSEKWAEENSEYANSGSKLSAYRETIYHMTPV